METSSKLNQALLRLIHFNVLSVHDCALSLPNKRLNKNKTHCPLPETPRFDSLIYFCNKVTSQCNTHTSIG